MKKASSLLAIGVFFLILLMIFSGCKKKYPTPEFTIIYTSGVIQNGDPGVAFFASCITTDVKMTKVEILDPNQSGTSTYNLNGVYHASGESFALQDAGSYYLKVGGGYQFTFTGYRTADNEGFSAVSKLNVSK